MFESILKGLVGTVAALALPIFGAMGAEWWEHRPAGTPAVHVAFLTWRAPDSLAAQRDLAKHDLEIETANSNALMHALSAQNAAIEANVFRAHSAMEKSATAVQALRSGSAGVSRAVAVIDAPSTGQTVCDHVMDLDHRFTEILK